MSKLAESGRDARRDEVTALVAQAQFARLSEFFTYPGWNKVIEYVGGTVIHIAVTRQSDGIRRWVHSNTVTLTDGLLGPMDMLVIMASRALQIMAGYNAEASPLPRSQ